MAKADDKKKKQIKTANPLEQLKDIGSGAAQVMRQEAADMSNEFLHQLLGIPPQKTFSGEISPGQPLEVPHVMSGKNEVVHIQRKRIAFERRLLHEEGVRVEKKKNELKMQLKVLQDEIIILADKTEGLAQETQIAAMQSTVEPGIYHVIFFEKLYEFIASFRKKIDSARVWLQASNKRAGKKNRWGANYKKHGAKYLLSGEHYVSRSAG